MAKSIYYLELSSDQNLPEALFLLGKIYYYGEYKINRDINKSIHYLELSSNQNYSEALLLLGLIYYENRYVKRDIDKSIYYLKRSSDFFNSTAQALLGQIYYVGIGIQSDINKAIHYLNLSAKNCNSNGQLGLGCIYYFGKCVPMDINKAINYLTLSAKKNNFYAQYLLGLIYFEGIYESKKIQEAVNFLQQSSNLNYCHAQNILGIIYKNGDAQNILEYSKNISNSIEYFNQAIKSQNDSFSCYNLARIYYFGINNIQVNITESIKLINKINDINFFPKYMFLFLIFFGENEAEDYLNILNNKFNIKIQNLNEFNNRDKKSFFYYKLYNFIKDCDIVYLQSVDYLTNFYYYMKTCQLIKIEKKNYIQKKDINEQFYEGFGI